MGLWTRYKPTDICPCMSGKRAKSCCLDKNGFWKISPSPLRIADLREESFQNLKCYMNSLGNCSAKASREHYISRGVLREVGEGNDLLTVGLPFLQQEEMLINDSSLTSKVLCEYHNNQLSPLDQSAKMLCSILKNFKKDIEGSGTKRLVEVICGEDIERWALKTLCATLASGNLVINGQQRRETVPEAWIALLTGKTRWPIGWGLYLHSATGQQNYSKQLFALQPGSISSPNQIDALRFWMFGLPFVLLLHTPDRGHSFGRYHPHRLIWKRGECQRILEISWNKRTDTSSEIFEFITMGTGKSPLGRIDVRGVMTPNQARRILDGQ